MGGLGFLQAALALVFVLALIGAMVALARRFGLGYRLPARSGRGRRLHLVEVMPLDAKRRLVLVRRDGTEHLILLGADGDTVIERDIARPAPDFRDALDDAGAPRSEKRG